MFLGLDMRLIVEWRALVGFENLWISLSLME